MQPHPLWPPSMWEHIRAEAHKAMNALGVHQLHFDEVPAAMVADQPMWQLNRTVAELLDRVKPSVLYAPFPFDLHKDHREVFHALSVAWRPSSEIGRGIREIYCYEVPSETHWNAAHLEAGFQPTAWVDISGYLDAKRRALSCYESQLRPAPDARSIDATRARGLARLATERARPRRSLRSASSCSVITPG